MNSSQALRLSSALALLALLAACPFPAAAEENMRFTGTVITPGCTVSDKGGRMNVVFQTNIGIEKIDGKNYQQVIPYQIQCPGSAPWRVRMTIVAADTTFDSAAVQTSIEDLGIQIRLNNEAFTLNVPREIEMTDRDRPPLLEAVPVKRSGSRLPEDKFEATALLIAELY
ncbi:fimbrial protein [Achromobacter marplatensis]|uniref:fimbrial protein n=1 Tax=Achromobacter marplatensis TaxID=470868 RepID=UPI0039F66A78